MRADEFGAFYFVSAVNFTPIQHITFRQLNFLANLFQFYVSFPDVVSLGVGEMNSGEPLCADVIGLGFDPSAAWYRPTPVLPEVGELI
ncbi:hypothetical protein [Thalassospira sp.]|uniref:hypothetical protein n=1 Tax=Thalassospira sp. TaxID=1912094 RepID=UPI0025E7F155|nr:hypothetical protein [Thalassospira sp.]